MQLATPWINAPRNTPGGVRKHGRITLAGALAGALITLGTTVHAEPVDRAVVHDSFDVEYHNESLEAAVAEICGEDVALDVVITATIRTKLFFENGELVRLIEGSSQLFVETTSRASGASISNTVPSTAHVRLGAGEDGRDLVRITGMNGQLRVPGVGVVVMDAGQVLLEAYGPRDPNPIIRRVTGRADRGPFPGICNVAAHLAAT